MLHARVVFPTPPLLLKKTTLFITHDLDEAIRMGSRIAIMKDGEIVQTGTPEDIVTRPADDYVADFVAGISKLKLVYAHTVMVSVAPGARVPPLVERVTQLRVLLTV